jgi:hypothetical protein
METLSSVALEENALVAEDAGDEIVHGRLREDAATLLAGLHGGNGFELGWAFYRLLEEVSDVDGSLFAAQHPARHAGALDVLAVVLGDVTIGKGFEVGGAGIEGAVEGFFLVDPDCFY